MINDISFLCLKFIGLVLVSLIIWSIVHAILDQITRAEIETAIINTLGRLGEMKGYELKKELKTQGIHLSLNRFYNIMSGLSDAEVVTIRFTEEQVVDKTYRVAWYKLKDGSGRRKDKKTSSPKFWLPTPSLETT